MDVKRSHKLSPEQRRQKIASVIIPDGWCRAGSHVLLSKEHVLKIFSFSDSTFSVVCSAASAPFPKPYLYVTPRQPRWLGEEVFAWLMRLRERRSAFASMAVPTTAFKVCARGNNDSEL